MDERDAAVRDLTTLRGRCHELANQWDRMAPAPGSYTLAARELRQLLAEHGSKGVKTAPLQAEQITYMENPRQEIR